MKKLIISFMLTLIIFAAPGVAKAVTPITFTDIWDPTNDTTIVIGGTGLSHYTYTHSILGPSAGHGFNSATDTLSSANLNIDLVGIGTGNKKATVVLDTDTWITNQSINNSSFDATISTNYLSDGAFDVTITPTSGSFYFDKSTLTANGSRDDPPAPEPTSMLLFSIGAVGLAVVRRKVTL